MRRILWFIVATLALPFDVLAQSAPMAVLDLATPITHQPVAPGEPVLVRIGNRLPAANYVIEIQRRFEDIPPLQAPNAPTVANACSNMAEQFALAVGNAKSEQAVAETIRTFRTDAANCTADEQALLEVAIKSGTTHDLGRYTLHKGEHLIVKIKRDDQSWEFTLTTGERGQWRTFYGFTFLPNDDEQFFTEQDPANADQFIITQEDDREEFDFAPSVLFVWSPRTPKTGTGIMV